MFKLEKETIIASLSALNLTEAVTPREEETVPVALAPLARGRRRLAKTETDKDKETKRTVRKIIFFTVIYMIV